MAAEERNKINYAVVCVNEFAKRHGLTPREAFTYLYEFQGIRFLKEHYDIEHTLSIDDAVDDLTLLCSHNGGALA